jgi:hypothetical protein
MGESLARKIGCFPPRGECQGGGGLSHVNVRLLGDDGSLDRDLGPLLSGVANSKDLVAHFEICDAFAHGADHAGKIST